jgi:hypothetical protein
MAEDGGHHRVVETYAMVVAEVDIVPDANLAPRVR